MSGSVGAAVLATTFALSAAGALVGCAASVTPRLPEDVAAALARTPMRRLESLNVVLYYPEARREEALRFLDRAEMCTSQLRLRAEIHNGISTEKVTLLLPEVSFNNAFSMPRAMGYEAAAVVPTHNTIDYFWMEGGQPPDPPTIACHELAHYVHMQQIAGLAAFLNGAFGQLYTPQVGLDSWFHEGLAVNYETMLQPGVGRLAWPFWHGAFAAGVAGRRLRGGDLHDANRDFHGGNNYLVGSYFVRFLIDHYGEEKLWKLIAVQARSIFSPMWVNVRFWQAYDKSLSTLLDEFADEVQARYAVVARPATQHVIRNAGRNARYTRAADGTEALIWHGHDRPTRLTIFAPDGRVRFERNLVEVVPPRRLQMASPTIVGGLSFTRDARQLYFAALDMGMTFQTVKLLRFDLSTGDLRVVHDDLNGVGGSVSPDGRRYVFGLASGDHHDLAVLDLATHRVQVLASQPHGGYVSTPRFSPDGTRILASRFDGVRFVLTLFDATSGKALGDLSPGDGPTYDASWVDDRRIVTLAAGPQDVGFQVVLVDVETGSAVAASRAPYLAFEPHAPDGKTLRFLNREGWGWTLDEVPLPELPGKPATSPGSQVPPASPQTPATSPQVPGTSPQVPGTSPTGTSPPQVPGTSPGGTSPAASQSTPHSTRWVVQLRREVAAWSAETPATGDGTPTAPSPAPVTGAAAEPTPPSGSPAQPSRPPEGAPVPEPAAQAPPAPQTPSSPPAEQGPEAPAPEPAPEPAPVPDGVAALAPDAGLQPGEAPVLSDQEYSQTDNIFLPQMHALSLAATNHSVAVGLTLAGGDRLQIHRWALGGYYEMGIGPAGVSGGYTNRSLAPVTISAQGLYLVMHDAPASVVEQAKEEDRKLTTKDLTLTKSRAQATLDVWRSMYGNPVGLGFVFTQQRDEREENPLLLPELRRMAGPHAFAGYSAFESTPYTGARRGVLLSLDGAWYPKAWSTLGFGLADVRAQVAAVAPLPLWRRHTLTVSLRGHALVGASTTNPLLQVGGGLAGVLYRHSSDPFDRASLPDNQLPDQLGFYEPLRGYEDFALATDRIAIADVTYRAPFIIDWGTASTLGLLPAFFLSQLDLRAFATAATDGRAGGRHLAVGASLTASVSFLLPMDVRYQLARRLDDDRALVHLIMLSM